MLLLLIHTAGLQPANFKSKIFKTNRPTEKWSVLICVTCVNLSSVMTNVLNEWTLPRHPGLPGTVDKLRWYRKEEILQSLSAGPVLATGEQQKIATLGEKLWTFDLIYCTSSWRSDIAYSSGMEIAAKRLGTQIKNISKEAQRWTLHTLSNPIYIWDLTWCRNFSLFPRY